MFILSTLKGWLDAQISISLKTSTLVILVALVALVVSTFIRYRVTTRYSRLSKDLDSDAEAENAMLSEMWNEPSDSESDENTAEKEKLSPASHFDEFSKAIKVFGYLESDVFNELTKSTRTLRVNTGEMVNLKDLEGFTVVISGSMKVYCQSENSSKGLDLSNEIKRPAPISSLSSISSSFSEGIETQSQGNVFDEVNATICAVANEPSTIVVIPADAFRDLTWKFPLATANIVQIISFRWSQITFRTCQRYLNLTQQFYGTERYLNDTRSQHAQNHWSHGTVENVVRQIKTQLAHTNSQDNVMESNQSRSRTSLSQSRVPSMSDLLPVENPKISRGRNSSIAYPEISRRSMTPDTHSAMSQQNQRRKRNLKEQINEFNQKTNDHSEKAEFFSESRKSNLLDVTHDFSTRREIVHVMFTIIGSDPKEMEKQRSVVQFKETNQELNSADLFAAFRPRSNTSPELSQPRRISSHESVDNASEKSELMWYRKGQYVSRYGDRSRGLIYVLDGALEVRNHPAIVNSDDAKKYQYLYDVKAGHITGFLETISSSTSFVDLYAKEDTCVAIIPKSCFDYLVEIDPSLYISVAKTLTNSLSRPMVQSDFSLEWISSKSGDRVLRQGATADSIYFVSNGRLRAYQNKKVVGEFGQGTSIGELETMSGSKYSATAIAVRDTEISRFPRSLIEVSARQYPTITFEMSRMVVQAMKARDSSNMNQGKFSDIKTIGILPTMGGIPIEGFASRLKTAFEMNGKKVMIITNDVILRYLGKYAFHKMGSLKSKAYLGELEDRFDIVLYVADGTAHSSWTRTCINEAYLLLLSVDGSSTPSFSEVEKSVVKSPNRSMAHSISLHREKQVVHGSTAKWLKHRPWITAHHHLCMAFDLDDVHNPHDVASSISNSNQPNRVQKKITQIKNRVQDEIKLLHHNKIIKRYTDRPIEGTAGLKYKDDFARSARILSGEAVGIVLGGGGARGLSHIGVLQALEEAGVPIDLVGGTSIGSLIGGLYAKDYDIVPLSRKSKQFSARVSSFWRLLLDLTYPMTAWTTGHAFNRAVWKCLGDSRIEDFWVHYFANTTNLSLSRMEVHQRGYAWRYIRASMSLAGLLPPIEEKGHMSLDGGYVDNLPVTEMKKMGARYVIAVDVGAVDDTTPLKYGDTLSGFWALINKYNPFSYTPNVPNIAEIQQRLTYVSSVKALEEAKAADDVIYSRPPIDNYATLDFAKFDDIRQVGFKYGTEEIRKKIDEKILPTERTSSVSKGQRLKYRRYSF